MSLESPLMLLGLIAVAIPIWLHLRKTAKNRIAFPAMSVLSKVARRRKKKIALRQKILLAARIVFIMAVVFAVSRPGVSVTRPGGIRSGAELGLVIIIDDSFSMRAEIHEGKTAFDVAKEFALAELGRLRPGDGSALILSGRPVRTPTASIEFNLSDVQRQIENLEPSHFVGDLKNALKIASRILLESPLPQREVIVLTDLAKDTFNEDKPPWPEGEKIGFRIIDATLGINRKNVAVDQVRINPSADGETKEAHIEARINNYSGTILKNFDVILEVEGAEVARGSVEIAPGQSAVKGFYHRFKDDGVHRGLVRIETDSLAGDNVRHFSVSVQQSITALVVDGDYRPGSYRDEAFYLRKALETPMPGEVPIRPVVVDVDAAASGPLTGKDVVFMAGVNKLDPGFASRIIDYVKKGGGIFISPGSSGSKLKLLETILPAKIRSIRQSSRSSKPFRIAAINRAHPVFAPFKTAPTGLEKTRVNSHLLVEPKPGTDKKTLIELSNGLPLLMERRVEMGRVMLLATTIDRDWTDLPIRPGYFPLIQRSARYLSGRLGERASKRIFAGKAVHTEVTEGMQRLVIRSPSGKDTVYSAADLNGQTAVSFTKTVEPGHYRVWAEIPTFGGLKELDTLGFVVETDPIESDLRPVMEPKQETGEIELAPIRGNLPVWPYLLIAALLLLFFETWYGSQGLRNSHVKKRITQ